MAAATVCLGMMASPAAAQTSAQQPAAPPSLTDPASDDVVVTAQRRSERLVDVPVSITVVDGSALAQAGVTAIDTVTKLAPGVLIDRQGAYLQPTIRGIGSSATGPGADPNVAIYVDGIYQSSQTGNLFDLPNVDQVAILKGPQGTLFGRNATGGAILITTKTPSFDTRANADLSYGRYNEVHAAAYATTGLAATLAGDLAVNYRRSDGWIKDLRTGDDRNQQHSFDMRSKLRWNATDKLSFILSVAYDDTSDPTGLASSVASGNSSGRPRPNSGPIADTRGELSHDLPPEISFHATQLALTGSYDLDFAKLASITAYRREDGHIEADLEGSYAIVQEATYNQFFKNFSQEVTLTSVAGTPLTWVLGGFYFFERSGQPNFYFNSLPYINSQITTHAISGFGDGTYTFGKLSLTAGIRYSSEKKRLQIGPGFNPYTVDTGARFSQWTPRAGIRYALTSRSNVYATYSRGFKSGTYNNASFNPTPVNPETVDAYEVGYKTSSLLFSLSTAGYYYRYNDIQVTAFDYTQGTSRLLNAAKAEIYGAEGEGTLRFSSAFDIRTALAYTHGRYTSFPGAPSFTPRLPGNIGNVSTIINASGARMIRAPAFTASGTANYRIPVGGGSVTLSATPYWSSRINYSFDERISQAPYFTLDATVTWAPNSHLRLGAYLRNATDRTYATFRTSSSARDSVVYAEPRTYGVSASFTY